MTTKLRVLNLYAGIGGNRALWDDDEYDVTAVEYNLQILDVYNKRFPRDKIWCGDAQQYLLDRFESFDVIWASPPCPTHSRARIARARGGAIAHKIPDMTSLYGIITFLDHFFEGIYIVENVIPWYTPLIKPTVTLDRHHFWSNRPIAEQKFQREISSVCETSVHLLPGYEFVKDARMNNKLRVLRNCCMPEVGKHVLSEVVKGLVK